MQPILIFNGKVILYLRYNKIRNEQTQCCLMFEQVPKTFFCSFYDSFFLLFVVVNNSKSNDDKGKYFVQSTMTTLLLVCDSCCDSQSPACFHRQKFCAYSNKIHINLNLIDQTKALLYHNQSQMYVYVCVTSFSL